MPATTPMRYFGPDSDIDPAGEIHSPPGPGVICMTEAKQRVVANLRRGPTFWLGVIHRTTSSLPGSEAVTAQTALRSVTFPVDEWETYPTARYIPYDEPPDEEQW
jgi:hypothetical protein